MPDQQVFGLRPDQRPMVLKTICTGKILLSSEETYVDATTPGRAARGGARQALLTVRTSVGCDSATLLFQGNLCFDRPFCVERGSLPVRKNDVQNPSLGCGCDTSVRDSGEPCNSHGLCWVPEMPLKKKSDFSVVNIICIPTKRWLEPSTVNTPSQTPLLPFPWNPSPWACPQQNEVTSSRETVRRKTSVDQWIDFARSADEHSRRLLEIPSKLLDLTLPAKYEPQHWGNALCC